ncbi:hypothetical protein Hanom_Chr02g00136011 [Helianthus anomalus]
MYRELTDRIDKLDTSVAEIKDMLQQVLKVQKVPPTATTTPTAAPPSAATSNELWSLFQPLLQQQRELADKQHEIQIQQFRNLMESRFKDTQADIKAIKAHILNTTGNAPPTVIFVDKPPPDNAKRGRKSSSGKRRDMKIVCTLSHKKIVKSDRKAKDKSRWEEEKRAFMELNEQGIFKPKDDKNHAPKRKKPTRKVREPRHTPSRPTKQTPKPAKNLTHQSPTQTTVVTPAVSTIVGTSVVSAVVKPKTITSTTTTAPTSTTSLPNISSPSKLPSPPVNKQKTADNTSSVVMTTVVETPVVSTTVSQQPSIPITSTTITTNQITTIEPSKTSSASPQPKRRRLILKDDDSSPPPTSSQPLSLVTIPYPVPLSSPQIQKPITDITPAGVQYPLELIAVREKIKSFYFEDDPAKRSLSSVEGYPRPNNIEEYLKVKAQQAEDISKKNSQGKSDKEIQRHYQRRMSREPFLLHGSRMP